MVTATARTTSLLKRLSIQQLTAQAKLARTEFLREKSGPILRIIGGIGLACLLVIIVMFGYRPDRQRALEATIQMEQLTAILGHAKAIAPNTAREITQLISQPVYDCGRVTCGAELERRNLVARLRLKALLSKDALPGEGTTSISANSRYRPR